MAELLALCLAGVLGATLPQIGGADALGVAALRQRGALLHWLVDVLGLDHVFRSVWFIGILVLATGSLLVVLDEQLRRLQREWTTPLRAVHFEGAAWRKEFERVGGGAAEGGEPRVQVGTRGKLGLAGSPIFHLGLLLVVIAGAWRALFAVDAVTELLVGQTLPATAKPWTQWPGPLASPFALAHPLTLTAVQPRRFPSDELRDLRVRLTFRRPTGLVAEELAIHDYLAVAGGHIFADFNYGPAALLEWRLRARSERKEAVLLRSAGGGRFEGRSGGPAGLVAHLRASLDREGSPVHRVELRVMRSGVLVSRGALAVGQELRLSGGVDLRLHGLPFWARLRGSRDPALWLAYVGFMLVLLGATLIFAVIRVDTYVAVTTEGNDREHVVVALRAQRFAPLFRERFERLVEQERGEP